MVDLLVLAVHMTGLKVHYITCKKGSTSIKAELADSYQLA